MIEMKPNGEAPVYLRVSKSPPVLPARRLPSLGREMPARIDSNGRTFWIADAHRDDGRRFVVHADQKLTAFLELESQLEVKGVAF